MRGVIRKLRLDHGYGFIRGQEGRDWFFHRSDVIDGIFEELAEADTVDFEEGQRGPKGPRAAAVRAVRSQSVA